VSDDATIRPAGPDDLSSIVALCAAHAAYERATLSVDGLHDRLAAALFGDPPRVWCLVAEIDARIEAYATLTREYSTWRGAEYLHVDCVYVSAERRGRGLGRALMEAAALHASRAGTTHVEWQTPGWNEPARRFYERLGAAPSAKVRFTWNPGGGAPIMAACRSVLAPPCASSRSGSSRSS
jgi:GNAT superfamily N-acetyltransferase